MTDDRAYQTRVYRFRAMDDVPAAAVAELRRAHELSNLMIEVEKDHAEAVAEAWREHPELEKIEQEIVDATEAIEQVVVEMGKEKQETRSSKPSPEMKARLLAARKVRRECKKRLSEAKKLHYPLLKERLNGLNDVRRQKLKDTYKPAVAGGLYWANYNAVKDRHEAAVKAVRSSRKMGKPADLRFRRWTGEGTLVVQLQRATGQAPRLPETVADLEKGAWRNVGALTPALDPEHWDTLTRAKQRRIRMGNLRFRVGAGDEAGYVNLPVIVHRPIPPDADICMMEISRRRLGSRMLVHVSVVVRLPEVPKRTEGTQVCLHVGWRGLDDGSIRVGVITGPWNPPEELQGVVRRHGEWAEIVIPGRWRDQMEYVQSLVSIRSKNLDVLKKWILEWLDAHSDHSIAGIETIERWRSPNRFAALSLRIRSDDSIDHSFRRQLEAWRRQDLHVWDIEANLRAKILARRNDSFAKVAAWALDEAAVLTVDSFRLSALSRKPDIGEEDNEAHRRARANRVMAAPGILRGVFQDAAGRRGVHVDAVDGKIAGIHYLCGTPLTIEEREAKLMVHCANCDKMVDQDYNTLELMRLGSRG